MSTHDEEHRDTPVSGTPEPSAENVDFQVAADGPSADGTPAASLSESEAETDSEAATDDNSADTTDRGLQADADLRSAINDIRKFVDTDDTPKSKIPRKISLASILGGDVLAGPWFRKQIFYIIMCMGMVIVYISNRYTCQQKMIEQKMLTDTLLDRRYKALTRSAQLKERMRRSYIEESLEDTTLQTANTPSYNLKVEDE